MKDEDRLKLYQNFADLGRKWSSVMDAKAAFLSTLNGALIGFIWTGARLANSSGYSYILAFTATLIAAISLFISLMVVLPRTTLKQAFGSSLQYKDDYHAVSFFGYVVTNYPSVKHVEFMDDVEAMSEKAFAREALEQHYTISHIVQNKSNGVACAGMLWLVAVALTIVALIGNINPLATAS